ncbi:MAG: hypothetical protein EBS92_05905 [Proteobacteria bacterium]|nr:hypothetical protein [Pseudomonadota bacterium]
MTDDLDPKPQQHSETSVDKAKEKAKEEALLATKKLIESLEEERRVELEALLAKQKLTQITNENHKAALEEAIKELSKHNLKSPEQKMSLVEWFCRKSPQFNDTVNLLEKTADSLQLPELVESFVKKLDKHFSSPETNPYKQINIRGSYPNEIKLNKQENLIDQLNEKGVDLDLFDEKISKLARPLNINVPHYVQITLPDNRFLTLDIFQYERDKAQSYGPPSGPQESNQEQPALGPQESNQEQPALGPQESNPKPVAKRGPPKGILRKPVEHFFAEQKQNSENQKKSFEENAPPNYLPQELPKNNKQSADGPPLGPQETPQKPVAEGPKNTEGINKKITFAAEVKQEDGTIGTNGYWVSATKKQNPSIQEKHPKNFSRSK